MTTKEGNGVKVSRTVHDRTIVILVILMVLAFTLAVISAQARAKEEPLISTSQSPSSLATSFDDDLNSHDSAAAAALFSDGAIVSDLSNIAWCSPAFPTYCGHNTPYTGTTQIRGWLDALIDINVQLNETQTVFVSGNNVSWAVGVSIDPYRTLEIAPLMAGVNATVENGKFSSLSIGLTAESTRELSLALAAYRSSPYSVMAGGFAFGVIFLGLVFPAVGVYYVSRVKRLFATVPHLDKPWVLLGGGLGVLFISVLLLSLGEVTGIPVGIIDPVFSIALTICAFLVMSSMILMKRVMLGESDE